MVIGYTTVGASDLSRSKSFYDEILGMLGARLVFECDRACSWQQNGHLFGIVIPTNGEPATYGNGTMIALDARERTKVDLIYERAMALGAKSEGLPALRAPFPEGTVYSCYFRDPDGNKIAIFCSGRGTSSASAGANSEETD